MCPNIEGFKLLYLFKVHPRPTQSTPATQPTVPNTRNEPCVFLQRRERQTRSLYVDNFEEHGDLRLICQMLPRGAARRGAMVG
ncbi:hypothetical protein E2C01_087321 [Portunus trituberculatus]|uniref:Uncharacterized protein n=1 Tax=Portunus trituberculatus TaxID=210409 RepID=A0A5B7J7T9_PORTR|nr:hypothetical protein [Portunus trituberculatus]